MDGSSKNVLERQQYSRERAAELIEYVRGKGKILILTHDNPDPDALAAAVALQLLILWKTGQEALIAFGGVVGRGENRVMVQELEIATHCIHDLDLDCFKVVCLVDTQPGTGNNSWPIERPVDVVIDHHPIRPLTEDSPFVDIRELYGASATILFEYLKTCEISINTKLATILYYAIKSETQDLGREWSRADREAYLYLLPLANNRILYDITRPQVPASYFTAFSRALENTRLYGNVLVFNLFDIDHPDIVAELADFLLRWEGVEHVLGMGQHQGMEVLSFRTSNTDTRADRVIRDVLQDMGTSGGHGMMAGGQIHRCERDREEQLSLERLLTRRLLKTLDVPLEVANPMLAE